ncbi:MAG: SPFH domain-containing protein [Bacteroidetes bacterium]|nr:SPFH domain-containing protein [Bacteroidota bacterium]
MGLFDFVKSELIDVIEWVDSSNDTIIWKFPRKNGDHEIKNNAKLTVRESQQAVFLNEGVLADVFKPGMHTLQTQNMPILATLKGWKYGFDSPFKADVYFVSTKQFVDQKWGTKNPITIDDERFGMIEVRAFGNFSYRVSDAGLFLKEIAGTDTHFTTDEISDQLKTKVLRKFTDIAASSNLTIDKFASNLDELSDMAKEKLNDYFMTLGLQISDFNVENVSMPEDIKKEIFAYSRMNKQGDNWTKMNTMNVMNTAAGNEGMGGAGMGMGVGMGMGNMMGNMMGGMMNNQNQQQNNQQMGGMNTPPPPPQMSQYFLAVNGAQTGPFTPQQLQAMIATGQFNANSQVWKNGMPAWGAASSVPELQALFGAMPPPPPPIG